MGAVETPSRARRGQFIFVGGRLALDLLNTRLQSPAEPAELLANRADLSAWAETVELPYAASLRALLSRGSRSTDVRRLRALREAIRRGLMGWQRGSVDSSLLDWLNSALQREPRFLQLRTSSTGTSGYLASRVSPIDRLCADTARSAARMILHDDPQRFRTCEGPRCSLVFYDQSKPGTRHWCSMERCGRQAKIRAFGMRRPGRR
jgi:predicted RNA-binding Zn ribbon-like protein